MNPRLFDLNPGDPIVPEVISACASCPVRLPCLEDALAVETRGTRYGIRGGYTPQSRARLVSGYPVQPIFSLRSGIRKDNLAKLRRARKAVA
jgi:hypothetical protein